MFRPAIVLSTFLILALLLVSFGSGVSAQGEPGSVTPPKQVAGVPSAAANPVVRVGLAVDRPSLKAGSSGPFDLTDLATGQVVVSMPSGELGFTPAANLIKVSTVPVGAVTPVVIGAYAGPLRLRAIGPSAPGGGPPYLRLNGGPSYRGELRIIISPAGLLTAINDVPLESYLYGVVPREMPAGWAPEALKAQAVAARSYALYQMAGRTYDEQGFDLLATQDSQVYGGVDGEDPRTNAAVDATAGQVITYNGQIADALFHASSGGSTENSEIVFGSPMPYLRGVPDFDQGYVYYSWTTEVPLADMERALNDAGYIKGRLYSVGPSGTRGVSGRYTSVKFVGSFGVKEIKANDFRRLFSLRSTLYNLINQAEHWEDTPFPLDQGEPVVAAGAAGVTAQLKTGSMIVLGAEGRRAVPGTAVILSRRLIPAVVRIDGHGWGHGLGLSQAGANALAVQKGYTYQQILQYYYQGVKVEVK